MTPPLPDFPRSAVCVAARNVARQFYSRALYHHCVRSYVWAAAYGTRASVAYDPELLWVGSLLHDIGLVPEFDSHRVGFDDASGHVARVFATGAGWDDARCDRLVAVVLSHMWDTVDVEVHPEGFLLERSTSMDISGRHTGDVDDAFVAAVLDRYPRAGIAEEFLACFRDQAARKPESSPGRSLRHGIAERIRANPLDRPGPGPSAGSSSAATRA